MPRKENLILTKKKSYFNKCILIKLNVLFVDIPLESNPPFKFLAIKYPPPPPKKQSGIKHTGAIWTAIFQNLTPKYQRVGRRPVLRNRLNLSAPSAAESCADARLNNISGNWRRIKEKPPATEASASPYISFISSRRRTEKSQQKKKATKSHLHVNDNTGDGGSEVHDEKCTKHSRTRTE